MRVFTAAMTVLAVAAGLQNVASADGVPFQRGDVLAGVGSGLVKHFDSAGNLLDTLNTTSNSSEDTGMCFDADNNLYTTNFSAQNMAKFDQQGNLLVFPWGGPFSVRPETCVVDGAGNVYTGEVDGAELIRKFDPDGNLLATFNPAKESRGVDWMDLAADQCTMFYTSEGSSVKRFDVCTNTQLADFATGLTRPCFALRIRENDEVIVTCSTQTYRLAPDGSVIQTYPIGGGEFLFAMNLDPDREHFWTGGISSGNVYKVNIETGAGTAAPLFNAGIVGGSMAGLAVFGEPTVGIVDENPPLCDAEVLETFAQGTAEDSRPTEDVNGNNILDPGEDLNGNGKIDVDTGIFALQLQDDFNLLLTPTPPFLPGAPLVDFRVDPIDPNALGVGNVVAIDGRNNTCEVPIQIGDFDTGGEVTRPDPRTARLRIPRPSPDTDGVRCVETDMPDDPDFTGIPFTPFANGEVEIDVPVIDGDTTVCCEFIDNQGEISEPACQDLEFSTVKIDILPGVDPNVIKTTPLSGTITVALLGSEDFDIFEVDGTTLAFGPGAAEPEQVGAKFGRDLDVNDDGFIDLFMYFEASETGIGPMTHEACLTGETFDGMTFASCDAIVPVSRLGCGLGFELVLALPPMLLAYRKRKTAKD